MKNKKCLEINNLPDLKCSNIKIENRIKKVIIYLDGNCYDECNNYLGKGIFENNNLRIIQNEIYEK